TPIRTLRMFHCLPRPTYLAIRRIVPNNYLSLGISRPSLSASLRTARPVEHLLRGERIGRMVGQAHRRPHPDERTAFDGGVELPRPEPSDLRHLPALVPRHLPGGLDLSGAVQQTEELGGRVARDPVVQTL